MSITATCGHILTESEGHGKTIYVKDYCKDGSKAVSYITVCDKCCDFHKKEKLILATKRERDNWLEINK